MSETTNNTETKDNVPPSETKTEETPKKSSESTKEVKEVKETKTTSDSTSSKISASTPSSTSTSTSSSSSSSTPSSSTSSTSSPKQPGDDEPRLADELRELLKALKASPIFYDVSKIVHWEDQVRSGLVFGIINFSYFLLSYGNYSVVTLFSYCALALLISAFAYSNGIMMWGRYVQGIPVENPLAARFADSRWGLSKQMVERHVACVTALANALLGIFRDVFYIRYPLLSIKFAAIFYAASQIGKIFSGFALVYLIIVVAFIWPRLYNERKEQIDKYYHLVHDQASKYIRLGISKFPKLDKRKSE
eukprot:TRINITY_DN1852_c0_g2_i1.p1 TRINITY_DN1852_c0_g2~~TRINITY_DN1852_c0_g2_i1.p1  ORF type:complete len:306 (+),score=111.26 TRINITY_DN1852_c0_g2_i1:95-1012(+)